MARVESQNRTIAGTGEVSKWLFWTCFIALIATSFGFIIRANIIGDLGVHFNLSETQKGEILGVGLWPFALSIILFSLISLMDQVKPTSVIDKWDFWVFSLSASGYFNGQKSVLYNSLSGSLAVNRITPDLKIRTSVRAGHYYNRYDIDGQALESTLSTQRFSGLVVKSLGEHWSAGGYLSLNSSSYSNIRFAI